MSIFGQNLATATAGMQLDSNGNVARVLNGTFVLVGGVASPLLYVSPTQINFIVPYGAANAGSATIQILTPFGNTPAYAYPIAASAPAIFTADSTGAGQAAVLNQDSTPNSLSNPAARGAVIQIFATGEGQTAPPGITGSITGDNPSTPALPVTVTIGGVNARVEYAGSAPHAVAGLFQVNAIVPDAAPIGARVPIAVSVGGMVSQTGVSIAVK